MEQRRAGSIARASNWLGARSRISKVTSTWSVCETQRNFFHAQKLRSDEEEETSELHFIELLRRNDGQHGTTTHTRRPCGDCVLSYLSLFVDPELFWLLKVTADRVFSQDDGNHRKLVAPGFAAQESGKILHLIFTNILRYTNGYGKLRTSSRTT